MLNYIEFLGIPTTIAIVLIAVFMIIQFIGELLEFKGKAVPEVIKIRKYFTRKKEERETMRKIPEVLDSVETQLSEVNKHYNEDNIAKRDWWITSVNEKLKKDNEAIDDIRNKVGNIENVLYDMDVQGKRRDILAFAEKVVDPSCKLTYESFDHISNVWGEYEKIISERGITNGVVEKSVEIISQEFERRLREGEFIEEMRGMRFVPKAHFYDK